LVRRTSVERSASVGRKARLKISNGRVVQGWITRSGADETLGTSGRVDSEHLP
jgi:hypothetical protein